MIDSGRTFTRGALKQEIDARFGPDARFHTCSAEQLTAEQLIAFLEERGKFIEGDSGFRPDVAQICSD